jgi:soluble cytochrome b562
MRFLYAAVLGLSLLGGCADLTKPADVPVAATLPEAGQTAQKAINEANILLISIANVVAQNKADGIYNEVEVAEYKEKLKEFAVKVDKAQGMVNLGDFTSAKSQAELLHKAITALHKEVASRARK